MTSKYDKINVEIYKKKVAQDHSSRTVRAYFSLYAWFWFHTEFWIQDPILRRPYTYIMRDWIYPHWGWFCVILAFWYTVMLFWALFAHGWVCEVLNLAVTTFSGWLCAHLIWGSGWKEGEQEWPPIIDI